MPTLFVERKSPPSFRKMVKNKEITFYKMVASGNDFVVVDNRGGIVTEPAAFTRRVCERHNGIGGDGVLLIENVGAARRVAPTNKIDYRVRIFNANGSEAETCGNGFRCIALLAHEKLGLPASQKFESSSGTIHAEIKKNCIRVQLVDPKDLRSEEKIEIGGRELRYSSVNTGVPHVVIFVEGLAKIPVAQIGREIRFHPRFQPAGTNANFVEVTGPRSIEVRTYERGVEDETLACGSGSTASAIISTKAGYVEPPVKVKTRGGEVLTVDFSRQGNKFEKIFLEGEAKLVYEGKILV